MIYQLILPGSEGKTNTIDYPTGFKFTTVGDVISTALLYLFPLAGLVLFFFLLASGLQLLTSAGNEEKIKKAHAQITNAILGFVILFVSFWLIKIMEFVFGIKIL